MKSKYLGKTQTFKNNVVSGNPIELIEGAEYDIDVKTSGTQMYVNGQLQITPQSDMIIIVNGTQLAYSAECLKKHWSDVFK